VRGIIFHAARTGGPYQSITPETSGKPLKEQLTMTHYGWPPDSKPKCLFHVLGETLLKRTVMLFREFGIEQIRIVCGYKIEMIEAYNNREKLDLEIMHNPDWVDDYSYLRTGQPGQDYLKGMKTVELGLEGMDDDLLMTYGDVLMMRLAIKECIESENPLAMHTPHIFKISKSHLHLLEELPKYGGGTGVFLPLVYLFKAYNSTMVSCVADVDYYNQTDEYRKERCLALRSQGLSFEGIAEKTRLAIEWVKMLCLQDGYPLYERGIPSECVRCNMQLEKTKNCEFRARVYGILCHREIALKKQSHTAN